jgi:TetR/AcrR family transcriptional regulator, tetracycline repressor protein
MAELVESRLGRPRRLTEERVVSEARRLGATDGVEKLTMRRLAEALGVMPNALYTYFPDKAAILDAVLDDLVGDVGHPRPVGDWRRELIAVMTSYRRLLLGQPGLLALTVSRPMMGPNALELREAVLTLMRDAGLGDADAIGAYLALFAYTTGFVSFETARAPGERDARQRAEARRVYERLPASTFPTTRALAKRLGTRPGDDEFRLGLDRLIGGFAERSRG